jgi:hypothetical protein
MSVPADKAAPPAPATPTKEEKLEKILKDFEAGDTKTNHPGKNLRELLEKSPDLKARVLDSVDKGHLEKFALLPAGANAGGAYSPDTRTIELPANYLKDAHKNKASAAELVFVMGHEIQHSFNSTASDKATDAFLKEAEKISKSPSPHDYTSAVKTLIQSFREDEASAHIGGFNAISSQVLKDNPKAGLKEIYNAHPGRMDDFIERSGKAPSFKYELKQGLEIEADMTIKATPGNVKAMGKHYFDQPPSATRIGAKGNQDYPNYYGEWAVNVIADYEKTALAEARKADPKAAEPEVKLNLWENKLDKSLLDTTLKYTDTGPKDYKIVIPAGRDMPDEWIYRTMCADISQQKFFPLSQERFDKIVDEMIADMKKAGKPIITPAIPEGELRERGTFEKDGKPTAGYEMKISESMQKDFITRVNEELSKSRTAPASPSPTPAAPDAPAAPDIRSPLPERATSGWPERPAPVAQDPYGGGTPFLRPEDVERVAASLREKNQPGRPEMQAYGTDDYRYFAPHADQFKSDVVRKMEAFMEKHLGTLVNPLTKEEREQLAGAVAANVVVGGLKSPERAVSSQDGKMIFVMDGASEHSNRVAVDVAQGIKQPLAQSMGLIAQHQEQSLAAKDPALEANRGPRIG